VPSLLLEMTGAAPARVLPVVDDSDEVIVGRLHCAFEPEGFEDQVLGVQHLRVTRVGGLRSGGGEGAPSLTCFSSCPPSQMAST
jgi:hypothetical protein